MTPALWWLLVGTLAGVSLGILLTLAVQWLTELDDTSGHEGVEALLGRPPPNLHDLDAGLLVARRAWIRPGARVRHELFGLGTCADPDVVRALARMGVGPNASGRTPVMFDREPLTYRWVAPAEVDPIAPADEHRLVELDRRFADAVDTVVRELCLHHREDAALPCTPASHCCVFCPVTREDRP